MRTVASGALALAVLSCCLGAPAAADASARGRSYVCHAHNQHQLRACPRLKFRYEGSGSYSWHYNSGPGPNGEAPTDQLASADFHWSVGFQPLIVLGPGSVQIFADPPNGVSGRWSFTESSSIDACSHSGTLEPFDNPEVFGTAKHGLHVQLRPGIPETVDPGDPQNGCYIGDFWQEWLYGTSSIGLADRVDALGSVIDVTPKQLAKRRTVLKTTNVDPDAPSLAPPADCSFGLGGASCEQSFAWTATVTIIRKSGRR